MIGDVSAAPMHPCKSLKSILPKGPNSSLKNSARVTLDKAKLQQNIIFLLKSKAVKNLLYLLIKSAVKEKSQIVEIRNLVSSYIILEQGIIKSLLPKAVKQENRIGTDRFIQKYIKYSVFKHLIALYGIQQLDQIDWEGQTVLTDNILKVEEHQDLCKILEMWASQKEGLEILNCNLKFILKNLIHFLSDESDVKYVVCPASTVLLDLTANAPSLEPVAKFMHQNNMLTFVVKKARALLEKSSQSLNLKEHEFRNKIRDLYIGITLNLTWNVDDEQINKFLVKCGSINLIKQ